MPQKGNPVLLLISSLFLGSALSLIISQVFINLFSLKLLNPAIPGMSLDLNISKTFDVTDFYITLVLSLILFFINNFKKGLFAVFSLLIFSITLFLQTHFVFFSAKQVLLLFVSLEIIYFALCFFDKKLAGITEIFQKIHEKEVLISLQNGLFSGFFLMLLYNNLTTIPLLSLMWLFFIPLLLASIAAKSPNSKATKFLTTLPGGLFVTSIFFSNNLNYLLGLLGLLLAVSAIIWYFKFNFFQKDFVIKFLNPSLLIFLLVFNPLFFMGNFDSVEEGFLLSWLQRLSSGEVLYKDVGVYHPPLITWGMYLFSKISGLSIYSERLFLHLLQITGAIIYFFFTQKLTKNIYFSFAALILFLSFTSSDLRNNVEIRVGIGLLSLLFFFKFLEIKKNIYLVLTGTLSAIALLVSFETGLSVIATLSLSVLLFSQEKIFSILKIKKLLTFFSGILIILVPFLSYLILTGALQGFIDQSLFYARAFSQGYFNSIMERSFPQSYFQFHLFNEYLSSNAIFWELTKLTFGGIFIYLVYKKFILKNLTAADFPLFITSLFGLILMRSSLGRSDWFHLLFVLIIAGALIFTLLSRFYKLQKNLTIVLVVVFLMVLSRPWINSSFLQKTFYKYQTYGKILGEYKHYDFERGKEALLLIDADNDSMNQLVSYLNLQTLADDRIFVYPWNPEVYFFANRRNATNFDTPYAFFTENYQNQMIEQLKQNSPKFIVFNESMKFGGLTPDSLKSVNEFINSNYTEKETFGPFQVLVKQ